MVPHTATILCRSPNKLLNKITQICSNISLSTHTLLFTLSSNTPQNALPNLITHLTTLTPNTIGCLSASLPPLAQYAAPGPLIACSLALFESARCVPFQSSIPGRPAAQVGRWHSFRKKDAAVGNDSFEDLGEKNVNWEYVWSRSAGGAAQFDALPRELQELDPEDVNTLLYLTDRSSEGLSASLAAFPRSTKLGLVASSTPFITGRPVTLFHNDKIYSEGAVGLALVGRPKPRFCVEFDDLRSITPVVRVTESEGNLINAIENQNPTRLLLNAIREAGIDVVKHVAVNFQEDESRFYVGEIRNGEIYSLYHIISGDPSRGTLALDSNASPSIGTNIQLFHKPKLSPDLAQYKSLLEPSKTDNGAVKRFSFMSTHEDTSPQTFLDSEDEDRPEESHVLENTFVGASENGFTVSRSAEEPRPSANGDDKVGSERAWACTVEGGVGSLEFRKEEY